VVLREGHDIVIGETCVPTSLNINNLGEAADLISLFSGQGYAYLSLQKILGKTVEQHLSLLMSSSHNPLCTFIPFFLQFLQLPGSSQY
jgi:hypothetical protein